MNIETYEVLVDDHPGKHRAPYESHLDVYRLIRETWGFGRTPKHRKGGV